ncbi:MAG: YggT family protein, partial [Methylocystis sp.]|nr:YggT family protein [Methylocystis sp.]
DVLNMRSNAAYQIWNFVNSLTEPLLAPIRNVIPAMGALDISPLILLLLLQFLRDLIIGSLRGGAMSLG